MSKSFSAVDFAYGTVVGRCILKMIMTLHLDRIAVRFLWSSFSKPLVSWYIKKNNIILTL